MGRLTTLAETLTDLRDDLRGSSFDQPTLDGTAAALSATLAGKTTSTDCAVCSTRLDAVLAASGETTHPGCEPS